MVPPTSCLPVRIVLPRPEHVGSIERTQQLVLAYVPDRSESAANVRKKSKIPHKRCLSNTSATDDASAIVSQPPILSIPCGRITPAGIVGINSVASFQKVPQEILGVFYLGLTGNRCDYSVSMRIKVL
mmetsp:Transcript_24768/g.49274  ORF Transcript_24768/g.49274 Transcript_24768/m.49274 type:complete len:128 (+) Transcript_24768:828-1211(+)